MSDSKRIPYGQAKESPPPEFTGERFIPGTQGDIEVEHVHRYLFARQFVLDRDVLDVACGEGYGCGLMADLSKSIVGVDIDEDIIRRAQDVHGGDTIRFEAGSCTAIPIEDASVDVVTSYETIEHIEAHQQFISEIRRVLRPEGLVVLSSPDTEHYNDHASGDNPFHVRELQRQEFIDLLSSSFQHVRFGVQRCLTGSTLVPLDTETAMTTPSLFHLHADQCQIEDAGRLADAGLYLVAVASDGPLPPIEWSILDDPAFAMSKILNIRHEHASMKRSIAKYEAALKSSLEELQSLRRSLAVRVASKLGLAPRRSDDST